MQRSKGMGRSSAQPLAVLSDDTRVKTESSDFQTGSSLGPIKNSIKTIRTINHTEGDDANLSSKDSA